MSKKRTAQVNIGYGLIFVLVVATLLMVGRYLRNAISGKLRQAGDVFGSGEVYDPDRTCDPDRDPNCPR